MKSRFAFFSLPFLLCPPAAALEPGDEFQDCETCPTMVVIPAGSFHMGSPDDEEGRQDDEGPVHEVTIARNFAVGKFEVTVEDYLACVEANKCVDPDWRLVGSDWNVETGKDGVLYQTMGESLTAPRHPIVGVFWDGALQYAEWISEKAGATYRLPTEAEWEYAARAGAKTRFSWGDEIGEGRARCFECDASEDDEHTAPVGSFEANAFGLHDMHGNVWEWTDDCYNEDYEGAPSDGSAWTSGECSVRVIRGGSFYDNANELRLSYRNYRNIDTSGYQLGFRLARDLD